MDLAERLADLKEKNDAPPDLTDKQTFTRYCELLSAGTTPAKAARELGRTGTWFRARRNPDGSNYDEDFARAYEVAMAEHKAAAADDALQALYDAAQDGNVRAIEKVLAAYHDDFGWMKPVAASGDLNVQQLQVFFGELPLEKLLELQEARQQAKMKALPVVDA